MIVLKSSHQIERMAVAGKALAEILELIRERIRPGVTTLELDRLAEDEIRKRGMKASFKNYNGFPATICASINDEVVHGFPTKRRLQEGDILSVDLGTIYEGCHADAARTFPVGQIDPKVARLVDVTERCFWSAMAYAKVGNRLSDISHAVQTVAEDAGYSVVRELCGHGVGEKLHEEPDVLNYGRPGKGPRLVEGMTLAIEPMINMGARQVYMADNEWTVVTADHLPSSHYENSIAITPEGPMILTLPDGPMVYQPKEDR
ncbi:MAG: type I methionyl aminopeptidase [Christensenellales bacterium]|jgi:methionyl aminopeptidase